MRLGEKFNLALNTTEASDVGMKRQQHLSDGVVPGGEAQGASREGAVEEELVDAAAGEEGHESAEAAGGEAAVAGVQDGAEGALEQEHHGTCGIHRRWIGG